MPDLPWSLAESDSDLPLHVSIKRCFISLSKALIYHDAKLDESDTSG
jgi:hypothetical protein